MKYLSDFQQKVLKTIGQTDFGQNFYWTGGILLSYLYFHHRKSEDLDFFSNDIYSDDEHLIFSKLLKKELNLREIKFYQHQNRWQYIITHNQESLKLEFVYFPFKNLRRRKNLKRFNLKADSLQDILTNKTLATYQRKEPKDVYDLYYFLRYKRGNLNNLIKRVKKKFDIQIEPTLLINKITEKVKLLNSLKPLLLKPVPQLSKKVENLFQKEFNNLLRKSIRIK